jgi:dipeptidyl aminopeptidase/acylaminoacyl peptidase
VSGERIAVVESEWDHPGDVFVADLDGGDRWRLTEVNADYLADREVQEPEEIWFDNGEGDQIQGWVLTPLDFDPEETYPMVVQIHGGPSPVMWTTSGTMWHEFQSMAHHGYVVFWSNPRGSTGYGKEFQQAVARDLPGPVYRDVMAGTDHLVERDYVDEDDLYVAGGSYGGYMTAWIVGQTNRFAAATPQRGVYDFSITYGTTANPNVREWYYGSAPWEEPELFHDHSPLSYAHEVDTPTLIIQSEHDYNCPRADAESLHRFIKKNGVDTRLVMYPREGHELSRTGEPAHVVDRMERILRWFDGYSDYFDVPPALERPPQAGLSTGSDILSTD